MNEIVDNIKRLAQEVKGKPKSGRLNLEKIKSNVQTIGFLEQSYSERDRAASDYAGDLFDKAVDEGFDGGVFSMVRYSNGNLNAEELAIHQNIVNY